MLFLYTNEMAENPLNPGVFRGRDIAFDIGNVILDFDFRKALDGIAAATSARRSDVLKYFASAGLAEQFERGKIAPEAFHAGVSRDLGIRLGFDEFAALWNCIFTPTEGMAELLAGLAGRYRLHAASNTNVLHKNHIMSNFPVFGRFSGIVASCDVGERKPDAAFYGRLVREIGADPADILFVDDLEANVEGAIRAGLAAVKFASARGLREDLARLRVEVR